MPLKAEFGATVNVAELLPPAGTMAEATELDRVNVGAGVTVKVTGAVEVLPAQLAVTTTA